MDKDFKEFESLFRHSDDCQNDYHDSKEHCFSCDHCDFKRCSPFQVRLAGIEVNLAFHLFRFKGCEIIINYECASEKHMVRGIICDVGSQFVDIRETEDGHKGKVTTIILERICYIKWLEKHCGPCEKYKPDHECETCDG